MSGSTSQSTLNTAVTLRRVSIYIFLAVAAFLVLVTAHLAYDEYTGVFEKFYLMVDSN